MLPVLSEREHASWTKRYEHIKCEKKQSTTGCLHLYKQKKSPVIKEIMYTKNRIYISSWLEHTYVVQFSNARKCTRYERQNPMNLRQAVIWSDFCRLLFTKASARDIPVHFFWDSAIINATDNSTWAAALWRESYNSKGFRYANGTKVNGCDHLNKLAADDPIQVNLT